MASPAPQTRAGSRHGVKGQLCRDKATRPLVPWQWGCATAPSTQQHRDKGTRELLVPGWAAGLSAELHSCQGRWACACQPEMHQEGGFSNDICLGFHTSLVWKAVTILLVERLNIKACLWCSCHYSVAAYLPLFWSEKFITSDQLFLFSFFIIFKIIFEILE